MYGKIISECIYGIDIYGKIILEYIYIGIDIYGKIILEHIYIGIDRYGKIIFIRICVSVQGGEDVDCMHMTQDRDRRRVPVNVVMTLRVPYKEGNFLTT
jgi:hypothetical protein